jgi:hypothetical protein
VEEFRPEVKIRTVSKITKIFLLKRNDLAFIISDVQLPNPLLKLLTDRLPLCFVKLPIKGP